MTLEFLLGAVFAAWFGLLTAVSPCPLASNIAAISFIGRRVAEPRAALLSGLLYTAGRTVVYVVLAALLVSGVLAAPAASGFLQKYMNRLLGPLLIVLGMVLLGLIHWHGRGSGAAARMGERMKDWGIWSAFLLGMVFALAFCPASAMLYFGVLLPLALQHESRFVLPLVYGVTTALPVVAFAVLIVLSANAVARLYNRLTTFELWARRVTGVLFLAIGVYYTLVHVFRV